MASHAGSPNGDFRTRTSHARQRKPAARCWLRNCGRFCRAAADHRLAASTTSHGTPIPGRRRPIPIVSSVAAHSQKRQAAVAPEGHEKTADLGASIKVRLGTPLVSRGPAPNIADAAFTEIRLPNNGHFADLRLLEPPSPSTEKSLTIWADRPRRF